MANAPDSRPVSALPVRTNAPDGFRVREFASYAVVMALGAAMLAGHRPGATATGNVTLLAGLGGCAWELARRLRSLSKQRAALTLQIARAQARTELKTARVERRTEQNTQRQRDKETLRRASDERAHVQRTERNAQNERDACERDTRSARFAAVSAESARLQDLPPTAWTTALTDILALRGLRLQTEIAPDVPSNAIHDMQFVRMDDGSLCVARSLPSDRAGNVADVEALEQWRREAGAQQAYLIGRSGFSAQAVRLAPRLPLILVEPNLLAQWSLTKIDSPPTAPDFLE